MKPYQHQLIRMKWSPDGRSVAYSSAESGLPVTLHLLNLDSGADVELLTPHESGNSNRGIRDFAWSPDGQQIVFAAGFDTTCNSGHFFSVLKRAPMPCIELTRMAAT